MGSLKIDHVTSLLKIPQCRPTCVRQQPNALSWWIQPSWSDLYLPTWEFILFHSPPASYSLSTTEAIYFSSLFLPYELYTCFLALPNAVSQGLPCFCHSNHPIWISLSVTLCSISLFCPHSTYQFSCMFTHCLSPVQAGEVLFLYSLTSWKSPSEVSMDAPIFLCLSVPKGEAGANAPFHPPKWPLINEAQELVDKYSSFFAAHWENSEVCSIPSEVTRWD